ncbi:MAG TPA: PIN domain-containing protein [Terriglobales bacterium]|nr:PIN domain-containing protein [Terriglobales bacterium]
MSAELALEFVDTNILVYAFDDGAGAKQERAARLLHRIWDEGIGACSVQILQEFYVATTRKATSAAAFDRAVERVQELTLWQLFVPRGRDVLAAIHIQRSQRLSFWDAMVVHAAAELGCGVLWSEDLNDGQLYQGVQVKNPFRIK